MKLKLEKQKVTTLSSKEMSNVNGGGYNRSARLAGGCNFSRRKENAIYKEDVDGNSVHVGCHTNDNNTLHTSVAVSVSISGSVSEDVSW